MGHRRPHPASSACFGKAAMFMWKQTTQFFFILTAMNCLSAFMCGSPNARLFVGHLWRKHGPHFYSEDPGTSIALTGKENKEHQNKDKCKSLCNLKEKHVWGVRGDGRWWLRKGWPGRWDPYGVADTSLSFVFLRVLAIHYRPIMYWPLFVLPGQPGQVGWVSLAGWPWPNPTGELKGRPEVQEESGVAGQDRGGWACPNTHVRWSRLK